MPISKKMDKRSYADVSASRTSDVSLSLKFARGPLRFVTSHSRFVLASLRNHARNEAPEEETSD